MQNKVIQPINDQPKHRRQQTQKQCYNESSHLQEQNHPQESNKYNSARPQSELQALKTENSPYLTYKLNQHCHNRQQYQQYLDVRTFKVKAQMCRIAYPLVLHDQTKPLAKMKSQNNLLRSINIKHKIKTRDSIKKATFKPYLHSQKTPHNEFLSYELSDQINEALKEAKSLAEQIKRIKQAKKKSTQTENSSNSKGVKIFKGNLIKKVGRGRLKPLQSATH